MFKFSKKDDSKYQSTINLIYDRNIHTLRSKVKILIVDDEEFVLINILKERKYDIYWNCEIIRKWDGWFCDSKRNRWLYIKRYGLGQMGREIRWDY